MERKTKIHAEDGKQELRITREFDLPVELLFRAHTDPDIVAQWMGTNVLKLDAKKHGGWEFENRDPQGNVIFRSNGVFHEFVPDLKFTRTFEMEGAPFGVQLEFYEFAKLTGTTSKLEIHSIFRSVDLRDQLLQLPFEYGLNMAHDLLEEIVENIR
jgi:uncharacterized protein YndB with AHSA1/START domain